jgi:hypothetical protein
VKSDLERDIDWCRGHLAVLDETIRQTEEAAKRHPKHSYKHALATLRAMRARTQRFLDLCLR